MLTPPLEGLVTTRKPKVAFLFPAPSPRNSNGVLVLKVRGSASQAEPRPAPWRSALGTPAPKRSSARHEALGSPQVHVAVLRVARRGRSRPGRSDVTCYRERHQPPGDAPSRPKRRGRKPGQRPAAPRLHGDDIRRPSAHAIELEWPPSSGQFLRVVVHPMRA